MSAETLFTAARRVVRFFNIDMNKGGLMTTDTLHAVDTLDKMLRADPRWGKSEAETQIEEKSK